MTAKYMGETITIIGELHDMIKAVDQDGCTLYIPKGASIEVANSKA